MDNEAAGQQAESAANQSKHKQPRNPGQVVTHDGCARLGHRRALQHRRGVGASPAAAGDRAAFAQMYDRYADRLHDFCIGMLRDRDGAADCVQDAFCIAATRLPQLREPDKLRPWLYSIARNEALRKLSERRRETPSEDLPDTMSNEPGPERSRPAPNWPTSSPRLQAGCPIVIGPCSSSPTGTASTDPNSPRPSTSATPTPTRWSLGCATPSRGRSARCSSRAAS